VWGCFPAGGSERCEGVSPLVGCFTPVEFATQRGVATESLRCGGLFCPDELFREVLVGFPSGQLVIAGGASGFSV
jgi:hypothetical protein